MKIVIVDGQGGRMGAMLVKKLREEYSGDIYAVGTNSIATSAMIKAGASFGATGENPVVKNARDADIIAGPIGIVVADAILGEVTASMAAAVGESAAQKVLIPVNNCSVTVAGVGDNSLAWLVAEASREILRLIK